MDTEIQTITFGRSAIRFTVVRSNRRRSITISVDMTQGVIVKAPSEMTHAKISAVVVKKAPWILLKLADFAELGPIPPAKEFVSGEGFFYLGRRYRLKLLRADDLTSIGVRLVGGRFQVAQPARGNHAEEVRTALIAWYKLHAQQRLSERVAIFAERLGVPHPRVHIRDPQKRWGSCSQRGELRFNWRTIMAPMPLVDYIVAHEVCHLRVKNHSPAFWRLLRQVMPDFELRRQRLREEGAHFSF